MIERWSFESGFRIGMALDMSQQLQGCLLNQFRNWSVVLPECNIDITPLRWGTLRGYNCHYDLEVRRDGSGLLISTVQGLSVGMVNLAEVRLKDLKSDRAVVRFPEDASLFAISAPTPEQRCLYVYEALLWRPGPSRR